MKFSHANLMVPVTVDCRVEDNTSRLDPQ